MFRAIAGGFIGAVLFLGALFGRIMLQPTPTGLILPEVTTGIDVSPLLHSAGFWLALTGAVYAGYFVAR